MFFFQSVEENYQNQELILGSPYDAAVESHYKTLGDTGKVLFIFKRSKGNCML